MFNLEKMLERRALHKAKKKVLTNARNWLVWYTRNARHTAPVSGNNAEIYFSAPIQLIENSARTTYCFQFTADGELTLNRIKTVDGVRRSVWFDQKDEAFDNFLRAVTVNQIEDALEKLYNTCLQQRTHQPQP